MREIKFKAWDGGYMYGHYIVSRPQKANLLRILTDEDYAKQRYGLSEWKVMQYTGLKDKNGVEIYEGDICTKMISPDEINLAPKELCSGEIVYRYGSFCLKVEEYYYVLSIQHGTVRVIGNIYENPELLKK